MEKIEKAAIKFYETKYNCWIIFTGQRHADILWNMFNMDCNYDKKSAVQGFLTNKDRFVNRYEAKEIAIAANQLIVPEEETYAELFSEDVW